MDLALNFAWGTRNHAAVPKVLAATIANPSASGRRRFNARSRLRRLAPEDAPRGRSAGRAQGITTPFPANDSMTVLGTERGLASSPRLMISSLIARYLIPTRDQGQGRSKSGGRPEGQVAFSASGTPEGQRPRAAAAMDG